MSLLCLRQKHSLLKLSNKKLLNNSKLCKQKFNKANKTRKNILNLQKLNETIIYAPVENNFKIELKTFHLGLAKKLNREFINEAQAKQF